MSKLSVTVVTNSKMKNQLTKTCNQQLNYITLGMVTHPEPAVHAQVNQYWDK